MVARPKLTLGVVAGLVFASACTLDRTGGISGETSGGPGTGGTGGLIMTGPGGTGGGVSTGGTGGTGAGGGSPDCSATEICVEDVTTTWLADTGDVDCPPGSDAGTKTVFTSDSQTAGCQGCTCAHSGGLCTADLQGWDSPNCTADSYTPLNDVAVGTCIDVMTTASQGSTILSGASSWRVTDVKAPAGMCNQFTDSQKVIPGETTMCERQSAGGSCGNAGTCVPTTTPSGRVCVEVASGSCPAGWTERSLEPVAMDSLNCSCSCSALTPTLGCSGVQFSLFMDQNCTMPTAGTTPATTMCSDPASNDVNGANYLLVEQPTGGLCDATDVAMGQLTFGAAVTVCCSPDA